MRKTVQKFVLVAAGLLLTTGVWATNVAQVIKSDGTIVGTYTDIKTAIVKWTAETTLQLLTDCELSDNSAGEKAWDFLLPANGTLDLNGHTLKWNREKPSSTGEQYILYAYYDGSTIKGGTLSLETSLPTTVTGIVSGIRVRDNYSFTIEDCTINYKSNEVSTDKTATRYAIYNRGIIEIKNSTINLMKNATEAMHAFNNSTVNIDGLKIRHTEAPTVSISTIYGLNFLALTNSLALNADIDLSNLADKYITKPVNVNTGVTVVGGSYLINGNNNSQNVVSAAKPSTVVKGGRYNRVNATYFPTYIADGYALKDNPKDGYKYVVKESSIAFIDRVGSIDAFDDEATLWASVIDNEKTEIKFNSGHAFTVPANKVVDLVQYNSTGVQSITNNGTVYMDDRNGYNSNFNFPIVNNGNLYLTGGVYGDNFVLSGTGNTVVSGGQYTEKAYKDNNLSDKIVPGSIGTKSGDYYIIVEQGNIIAMVGDAGFDNLQSAVTASTSENPAKLIANIDGCENLDLVFGSDKDIDKVAGKMYYLNMNGHTVNFANSKFIDIKQKGLTISGTGTINSNTGYTIGITGNSTPNSGVSEEVMTQFIVGENITINNINESGAGFDVWNVGSGDLRVSYNIYINFAGKINCAGTGATVNGNVRATDIENAPHIIVPGTAVIKGESMGIYAAGFAIWEFSGKTEGDTGVEVRAGHFTAKEGCSIKGTGTGIASSWSSSGSSTSGAGIGVSQHKTKLPISVIVEGGSISGYCPFFEVNPQNNSPEDIAKIGISIEGGNFKTINGGKSCLYSYDNILNVTGGVYSESPAAYLHSDKVTVANTNEATKAEYPYIIVDANPSENMVASAQAGAWENTSTWSTGKCPTELSSVTVSNDVQVSTDYTDYAYGIVINQGATLTLKSGSMLVVGAGGIKNNNAESGFVVEDGARLLIHPEATETHPYAEVKVNLNIGKRAPEWLPYSSGEYLWQTFAIPTIGVPTIVRPESSGLYIDKWDVVKAWVGLETLDEFNTPFKGYLITNNLAEQEETVGYNYSFKGKLAGNADCGIVSNRDGYFYFANSYLAPIDILSFLTSIKPYIKNETTGETVWNIDKCVYMYDELDEEFHTITFANLSDNTAYCKEIKPLQGFFVHSNAADNLSKVEYAQSVFNYNVYGEKPALRSALSEIDFSSKLNITLKSLPANEKFAKSDILYLYESAEFSNDEMYKDGGYDSPKMMNPSTSVNVYGIMPYNKQLASVAANKFEGMNIGITTNVDTKYKFVFSNVLGCENLVLLDKVENKETAIEEGAEYEFDATASSTIENRFSIVKGTVTEDVLNEDNPEISIFSINKNLYVNNNFDLEDIVITDMAGSIVLTIKVDSENSVENVALQAGSYIVKVGTKSQIIVIY